MDDYLSSNLKNWNERTPVHASSKFYDLDGFKAGKSSLKNVEIDEVGEVRGKALLHLQCHFGLDTLSWARMGAEVTGVDFSSVAIDLARSLAGELKLKARFICSEIFELQNVLRENFDIVFASYGVLCWISDVNRWMRTAAEFLNPNGLFYLIDDHPFMNIFESDFQIQYPYFHSDKPMKCEPEGSYTNRDAGLFPPTYQWTHSLSDIVEAANNAGLRIEFLHEFPFGSWARFHNDMKEENGWFVMKNARVEIPLLFSVRAKRIS